MLELDGEDLRPLPLKRRKGELEAVLKRTSFGLALNDYGRPSNIGHPATHQRLPPASAGVSEPLLRNAWYRRFYDG